MKKSGLFILFPLATAGLYAQQVQITEAAAKPGAKPAVVAGSDVPKMLYPNEAPAPAAVKASTAAQPVQKAAVVEPKSSAVTGAKPAEVKRVVEPAAKTAVVQAKVQPAAKPAAPKAPEQVKEAAVITPVAAPAPAATGFAVEKKHTVSGGDTLWDLSGKYYKDPYKWGKIYNANLGTVTNPDLIYPKSELVIPGLAGETKPEIAQAPDIAVGETVKEAEFTSFDIEQAFQTGSVAVPVAAAEQAAAKPVNLLLEFDQNILSEEMPAQQTGLSEDRRIAPDSWKEDGKVMATLKNGSERLEDSLSVDGAMIEISMYNTGAVRPGDYLTVYLVGRDAYDKAGRRLGRVLEPSGLAEVSSVSGSLVKARVIDSTTAISKGQIVKKK
ncbi:MAG: hypothetical protein COX65_08215 [Elusimicrobia bacterium CG_4_10_14_0_2_um_filter_56_8]|nr:MAG: hypothetical protein AUJ51_13625 [Elusimicrobia bacterium CG1_02_56_21]PJA12668.1 MAG: hypothetical protein COX65_08215 [Elusimicrobia bacterium CG_4_10_14_0_2_um_filter_56_8]